MRITESLKEYLTVDQNEWLMKDDYSRHILDYDGENELFESVISDADLEFLQHWTEKNGKFPIIGRLTSGNSNGEYEWSFSSEGHAKEGMNNLIVDKTFNLIKHQFNKTLLKQKTLIRKTKR